MLEHVSHSGNAQAKAKGEHLSLADRESLAKG
jgi:hypothetical protein